MNYKMGVHKIKKLSVAILIVVAVAVILGAVISAKISSINPSDSHSLDSALKGNAIDLLLVEKSARTLKVLAKDLDGTIYVAKTYHIALGGNPQGHKTQEGDSKTPEGEYLIDSKNPKSRFFLNLGISYPNSADLAQAKARGVSAGGDIKIHGLPNGLGFLGKLSYVAGDWSDGCIAVLNDEIKELYDNVKIGTKIVILP
ncbi:L,D-transpeptidase family protein [Helicobacter sp. T3_23-1059]